MPTRGERRLRCLPRLHAHERRHGQGVVHALELLVRLALVGGVPQDLADVGEVPALALRRGDALGVEQLGDANERRTRHAEVVDATDDRRPLLVDAPALALAVPEPGRRGTAAGLALPQRLDAAVRRLVADVPPLLAAHQALDRERDPPPEVPRRVDGPRAVHDDELVLLHQLHDVRGVVQPLLADEAVELRDAHLVDGSRADQGLHDTHPLGALGQGDLHRGDVGLEHRLGEDGDARPGGAQPLQRDELALQRLPALLPGGADAAVLHEAGKRARHHDSSSVARSDRSVPTRCADSEGEAGASCIAGL